MDKICSICPRGVVACREMPLTHEDAKAFLVTNGLEPNDLVTAHTLETPFTKENGWVVGEEFDALFDEMSFRFDGVPRKKMVFTNIAKLKATHFNEMTIDFDGRLVSPDATYFTMDGWIVAKVRTTSNLAQIFIASPDGEHHSAAEVAAVLSTMQQWQPCASATLCPPVPLTELPKIDLLANKIVGIYDQDGWCTSKVTQAISIELDAKGSAAAAVTVIEVTYRSMVAMGPPHIKLNGKLSLMYTGPGGEFLMCVALH